jgi:hypothetical protein
MVDNQVITPITSTTHMVDNQVITPVFARLLYQMIRSQVMTPTPLSPAPLLALSCDIG